MIQHDGMLRHALLFGLLCFAVATASARAEDAPRLTGTVVGIADGDTVDVRLDSGMIRVRLHAVDAPEHDQPYGKAARRALSLLVYLRKVEVEPIEQDQYDRLVARLWLGEMDVNAELLKSGAAWVYRRYAREPDYCAFEQEARALEHGLWGLPTIPSVAPWEWRQREKRRKPFTDYSKQTLAACIDSLGKGATSAPGRTRRPP
jgi:endonuclease YncB( thermonuclease family)